MVTVKLKLTHRKQATTETKMTSTPETATPVAPTDMYSRLVSMLATKAYNKIIIRRLFSLKCDSYKRLKKCNVIKEESM